LPGVPSELTFRSVVVPFARSRRKGLQHRPAGWSAARFVAFERNATSRPLPEMLGWPLGALPSWPPELTLSSCVVAAITAQQQCPNSAHVSLPRADIGRRGA
jgi:hypothetical protein